MWTRLHVQEQLGEVKLPLLTETGQLEEETNRVIRLVQAGQALNGAHGVQTLREEKPTCL